ncbi:MAG: hypothetical protein LH461_09970, partial [Spirochaetaceae bacterium]|nr:hypothetical protein [Spirochaetaceae bacterium]
SPDPWQENQRRVLAAASGRSRRVLTVAAVALALTTWAGGIAFVAGGGLGDGPAAGTGDPFTNEHLLGAPVEAERLTVDGQRTVHTIGLSDMTGKGPNLCDEYESVSAATGDEASGSSSGGCSTRDPTADDTDVAVDWLTGTEGSGDIRGVTAGVDSRVAKVRIWMDNGDMVLATLHPTGWDDTRMFTLTTQPPGAPTAQRLVAYGRVGNVLQAVDLGARFGDDWLPRGGKTCDGTATAPWPQPGSDGPSDLTVDLWNASARVTTRTPDTSTCLSLRPSALAGSITVAGRLVLVTGPEVVTVEVRSGTSMVGGRVKVMPTTGSPFQLADLPEPPPDFYRIVARDVSGQVVDQTDFSNVGH